MSKKSISRHRFYLFVANVHFFVRFAASIINNVSDTYSLTCVFVPLVLKPLVPEFTEEDTPEERQYLLLNLYRHHVNSEYKGRTSFIPVLKPGMQRILYYLVYLTRHPLGIDVFKTQAEKMAFVQKKILTKLKMEKTEKRFQTQDLFGIEESLDILQKDNNVELAKKYLLEKLSKSQINLDYDTWADYLEESDLYPSDFQEAMKQLVRERKVENINADVSKRRSKVIRPNWLSRSETWKKL